MCYLDLNVRYVDERDNSAIGELFGIVINLTDEDTPVTPYFNVFPCIPTQTDTRLFNVLKELYRFVPYQQGQYPWHVFRRTCFSRKMHPAWLWV